MVMVMLLRAAGTCVETPLCKISDVEVTFHPIPGKAAHVHTPARVRFADTVSDVLVVDTM
jgi:hypothetical protein